MDKIVNEMECMLEFKYVTAQDVSELEDVKKLFLEYAKSLGIDLAFQDFEIEFKELPGKYGVPDGILLLTLVDGKAAGCVALRKLSEGICEMKRLYVRDSYRGLKIGKRLVEMVIEVASKLHYDYMRLNTLSTLTKAHSLYSSMGFYHIEPYIYNPIEGAIFMELKLRAD
ncbi:MAG: GNAT family N-acetyltransferase [Bacillaceae bacterium]